MKKGAGSGGLSMFPSSKGKGLGPGTKGVSARRHDGPMSKAGGKAPKYNQHINNIIDKGNRG
jgi:hypothetical protein